MQIDTNKVTGKLISEVDKELKQVNIEQGFLKRADIEEDWNKNYRPKFEHLCHKIQSLLFGCKPLPDKFQWDPDYSSTGVNIQGQVL